LLHGGGGIQHVLFDFSGLRPFHRLDPLRFAGENILEQIKNTLASL
jgi:hypothetical protein